MTRMPSVTGKQLVRFLKKHGFVEDRWAGSHLTLRHKQRKVTVTIPVHSGVDVGRGLVRRILADAGFSTDDYLKLR